MEASAQALEAALSGLMAVYQRESAVLVAQTGGLVLLAWLLILGLAVLMEIGMVRPLLNHFRRALAELAALHGRAQASEQRLQGLHDHLADGVMTVGVDGVIRSVNPAMSRIFGYPAATLPGQPARHLILPEAGEEDWLAASEGEAVAAGEAEITAKTLLRMGRRHDGARFPLELRISRMTVAGETLFTAIVRDIGRQRQVEQTLQETNRLLALAEDVASVGHWVLPEDSDVMLWSDSTYRIFGLDPAAFTPLLDRMLERIAPHDRAILETALRRARETGRAFSCEARLRRDNGSTGALIFKGLEDGGAGASGAALFGIVQDISERKQGEAALAGSLERFRDYAQAASDWFWELNAALCFTYVSERFESVTGMPAVALLGRTFPEWVGVDPGDAHWQGLLAALAGRQPVKDFVFRIRRPGDARLRMFRISATPFTAPDGAFLGYRGVGSDITATLETQTALARSEARFRDLIEGSIQGVCIHRNYRPLFVNAAYARMMGFASPEEVLREPSILLFAAPEDGGRLSDYHDRLARGATTLSSAPATTVLSGVRHLRHNDHGDVWVDVAGRGVEWEGARAVQLTVMDVTARIRSERDLEVQAARMMAMAEEIDAAREEAEVNRQKAESANIAKSRFLAIMSHELRTPMAGIMGVVELLLGSTTAPDIRDMLRTLKRSADTLLTLLNDILDFSKIEAGQLTLEQIDFAPARVVEDVIRLFEATASEKGVVLASVLPDDLPAAVRGDPTRLRQVLLNLTGNALKFTERGQVAIRLSHAPVGDKHELRLEVEDTGIGMTEEQMARLFRPFTQADDSTTRRYGGTGLGLAICKRLVEAMGGDIGVVSAPGRGSTFRFTLLVQPGDPAALAEETLAQTFDPRHGSGLHLLLAEDNDINRMVISTLLTRMGHTVVGVADGLQAVQAVAEKTFDLVLMDMQMPELDGMEATQAIRAMPEPVKANLPIIGLTADALPEHHERYRAGGLNDVLTKPVDWPKLDATLRRFGGGRPAASQADAPSPPPMSPTAAGAPVISAASVLLSSGEDAMPPQPSAPPKRDDLIDAGKIEALRLALDDDGVAAMLSQLPDEFQRHLETLDATTAAGDLEAARRAAHQLRGLAGTFGGIRIAALCRQIELDAVSAAEAAALVPDLARTIQATLAGFQTLLPAG